MQQDHKAHGKVSTVNGVKRGCELHVVYTGEGLVVVADVFPNGRSRRYSLTPAEYRAWAQEYERGDFADFVCP